MNRKLILTFWIMTFFAASASAFQDSDRLRQEEVEDYYKKWLEQDVLYIISDEEKAVFNDLSTDEEKEQFIEQFWFRRDPNPRTAENEFKEEHYRRIAYANEKFTSGDPGWLTDRGRIYIIHGPPTSIEARPAGGVYKRPIEEGGGTTSVFPYEKWRYMYIEGIGNDVELEFVDKTDSGKYELAVFYWEKDATTWSPGSGKTLAEEIGMSTRADRPGMIPAAGGAGYGPQNMYRRVNDNPFSRYELVAKVGAAPVEKYKDLKELVEVEIGYEILPVQTRKEYFKLNDIQVLVPVTLKVENQNVTFKKEGDFNVARLGVFGLVSSLSNRVITEFEDDFVIRYKDDELDRGLLKASVYQKIITLENKGRYKIDLVVKDLNSGKVGVNREAIVPPKFGDEQMEVSSLVLSDNIRALDEIPEDNEMFVLGDVRILPNFKAEFANQMPLGVYFQVYNVALDESSLEPAIQVKYTLYKDGEPLAKAVDASGESTQFFSRQRVVLMKKLSLSGLEKGNYQIEIEVTDEVNNQTVTQKGDFSVVESS
jgi:GWxTD domain-containing protein